MVNKRPIYLDLFRIRLPLPGLLSILHRISGALMYLAIPFLLWLLDSSLHSHSSFVQFQEVVANPLIKLLLLVLAWGYLHHLCAGLRYLALDVDWGTELPRARASSTVVFVVSLTLTAVVGALLW